MQIKKSHWILIGIFLWGLPTAVFMSLLFAVMTPGEWMQAQAFSEPVFIRSLFFTIPPFILIGIAYGLLMHHWGRPKVD